MQVVYLIRHAETEYNRQGRVQGFTDSPLSELGRKQARRLRDRLRGIKLAAAASSPAARATDTARVALDGAVPFETYDGLLEMNLGVWEGRIAADLRRDYPDEIKLWFDRPSRLRLEGGETIRSFRRRVTATMNAIRSRHADKTVAVFTHGGVIRVYLTGLLGMKLDDVWRFRIQNCSLTRVLFPGNEPRIDLLGDIHHLDGLLREIPPDATRLFP
jgi:broad specificity phosphatase PhoE